ncbi:MAG TPA: DUF308 domain-containing protein [Polyangiaceae bacterium]|nr:DUF308 domain-containing protein [Polyangiaceae bacterium]
MRFTIFANWWALSMRASLGLLFGAFTLAWRGLDPGSLTLLYGAYVVAAGNWNLVGALRSARVGERPGPLFFEGLASAVSGAAVLLWPVPSAFALLHFVAARSVVTGGFEICAARRLRRMVPGEVLLALAGASSVAFGLALLAARPAAAGEIGLLAGAHAAGYGALLLALSLRLRVTRPVSRRAGAARVAALRAAGQAVGQGRPARGAPAL